MHCVTINNNSQSLYLSFLSINPFFPRPRLLIALKLNIVEQLNTNRNGSFTVFSGAQTELCKKIKKAKYLHSTCMIQLHYVNSISGLTALKSKNTSLQSPFLISNSTDLSTLTLLCAPLCETLHKYKSQKFISLYRINRTMDIVSFFLSLCPSVLKKQFCKKIQLKKILQL